MFNLEGEYTTAKVMADEDYIEEKTISQIETMINHPAFRQDVVIQPDTHPGAGSVIGFTMELGERVVPNVVGVDVGCGMYAFNIGKELPVSHEEVEKRVRDVVPMGRDVRSWDDSVHLVNEFPWEETNEKFERFNEAYQDKFGVEINPIEFDFEGYDKEYFKGLTTRVLSSTSADEKYIIKGAGTLGGGNHFIEFGRSDVTGDIWVVIHSGSRYIGKSVAEYWQEIATKRTESTDIRESLKSLPEEYLEFIKFDINEVSDEELRDWVRGGMGEDFVDYQKLKDTFTGDDRVKIEEVASALKEAVPFNRDLSELDWLEGREGHGYFVDMIFAQMYASWNRRLMADAITDALEVSVHETIESTHNYIDFNDMIIRKGATPAREDEKLVIPLNMADGILLCEGQGNGDWLYTAPHGAGRVMGRREAKDTLSMEEFKEAMGDKIYSESVVPEVLDEAPQAYKDSAYIERKLSPTAEVVDKIEVIHNIKAKE